MSRIPSLLLAAALFALAGSALAQPMPQNNPAAEQNVIQSERYSQVLRSNPSFRDRRMQEECGPVTDPQLHEECVASFPPGAPAPSTRRHRVRRHQP